MYVLAYVYLSCILFTIVPFRFQSVTWSRSGKRRPTLKCSLRGSLRIRSVAYPWVGCHVIIQPFHPSQGQWWLGHKEVSFATKYQTNKHTWWIQRGRHLLRLQWEQLTGCDMPMMHEKSMVAIQDWIWLFLFTLTIYSTNATQVRVKNLFVIKKFIHAFELLLCLAKLLYSFQIMDIRNVEVKMSRANLAKTWIRLNCQVLECQIHIWF